jgi:hypothetical protein
MNGGSLQKVALPLGESGNLISVLQMIVRGFPEHTEVVAPRSAGQSNPGPT